MSRKPKPPRRGRPAIQPGRVRLTITLSLLPEVVDALEAIRAREKLPSRSRAVEWLAERDRIGSHLVERWNRRVPPPATAEWLAGMRWLDGSRLTDDESIEPTCEVGLVRRILAEWPE